MPYVNFCRNVLWMLLFFVELGGSFRVCFINQGYQNSKLKVIVVFFGFDHSGFCLWPKGYLKTTIDPVEPVCYVFRWGSEERALAACWYTWSLLSLIGGIYKWNEVNSDSEVVVASPLASLKWTKPLNTDHVYLYLYILSLFLQSCKWRMAHLPNWAIFNKNCFCVV